MNESLAPIEHETPSRVENVKQLLREIASKGTAEEGTYHEISEYKIDLNEYVSVEVFDLFSYWSSDSGPATGIRIHYVSQDQTEISEKLMYRKEDDELQLTTGDEPPVIATENDLAQYESLLSYIQRVITQQEEIEAREEQERIDQRVLEQALFETAEVASDLERAAAAAARQKETLSANDAEIAKRLDALDDASLATLLVKMKNRNGEPHHYPDSALTAYSVGSARRFIQATLEEQA